MLKFVQTAGDACVLALLAKPSVSLTERVTQVKEEVAILLCFPKHEFS